MLREPPDIELAGGDGDDRAACCQSFQVMA